MKLGQVSIKHYNIVLPFCVIFFSLNTEATVDKRASKKATVETLQSLQKTEQSQDLLSYFNKANEMHQRIERSLGPYLVDSLSGLGPEMQLWGAPSSSYGTSQQYQGAVPAQAVNPGGYSIPVAAGGTTQAGNSSPYAGYLKKQIATYPVMLYTLNDCIPCRSAKQLLAVYYPDVSAHYLELSGNEPWQQQLQFDLMNLTGVNSFPYIFVCGQYVGGFDDLSELHQSGQLRQMVSQCPKTTPNASIPK